MVDGFYILTIFQDLIFSIILFISVSCSCLIIIIPRFRRTNNLFILNICMSINYAPIFYIIYLTIFYFAPLRLFVPNVCLVVDYLANIAETVIPFSFVTFSIHRFCSILYHTKLFFKTKQWTIICIVSQWMVALILNLPFLHPSNKSCINELWLKLYGFNTSIVISLLLIVILNLLIIHRVRMSARQVAPVGIHRNPNQVRTIARRRDIVLLKQMIFMFIMFLIGWTPAFLLTILTSIIKFNPVIIQYFIIVSAFSVLLILLYLIKYNGDIRRYLRDKFRLIIGQN